MKQIELFFQEPAKRAGAFCILVSVFILVTQRVWTGVFAHDAERLILVLIGGIGCFALGVACLFFARARDNK